MTEGYAGVKLQMKLLFALITHFTYLDGCTAVAVRFYCMKRQNVQTEVAEDSCRGCGGHNWRLCEQFDFFFFLICEISQTCPWKQGWGPACAGWFALSWQAATKYLFLLMS